MEMQAVDSSAIAKMGFDPGGGIMRVEFSSGDVWEYDCDQGTYNSIVYANSIGKAFHRANIGKGRRVGLAPDGHGDGDG